MPDGRLHSVNKIRRPPVAEASAKEAGMFNFQESSISQALKAQMNAQFSLFTQCSDKMLEGVQKINELNAQIAKTMYEDSVARAQQFLAPNEPSDKNPAPPDQAQPAAEQIRAYQQNVQNIMVETQASIAKIVETLVPETARAAEAVVREVTEKASENTVKATQRQKEALEKMAMPINQFYERAAQGGASKPIH
jgi:phasin family protein